MDFFNKDIFSKKVFFTVALVLYVVLMIVGAIIPNPDDVPVFSGNTKYFHFFGFIILSLMTFRAFELYNFKHSYIYAIILLLIFIGLTEFLQLFVSTRHPSFTDMLIDFAGCIIGWTVYVWIYFKR